jgi:hypothetical protein
MDQDDLQYLLKAVDNDDNKSLEGQTLSSIKSTVNNMLQQLPNMKGEVLKKTVKKLDEYRFIEDLDALRFGGYTRWFNLTADEPQLTNGGIVCDMIVGETGVVVKCKNRMGRIFSFNLSECLVFQKLSDQEKIILFAVEYLSK